MSRTALYRHFDAQGRLLYVGITADHKRRTAQHKSKSPWFKHSARVTVDYVDTRQYALALEGIAIQHEQPIHNKPLGRKTNSQSQDNLIEFQGPKPEILLKLEQLSARQLRGVSLLTKFLLLLPDQINSDVIHDIPIERFIKVAEIGDNGPSPSPIQKPLTEREVLRREASQ